MKVYISVTLFKSLRSSTEVIIDVHVIPENILQGQLIIRSINEGKENLVKTPCSPTIIVSIPADVCVSPLSVSVLNYFRQVECAALSVATCTRFQYYSIQS